jgi:hypothetical protein
MALQASPHLLPELWDVHHAGISQCAEWGRSGVALTAPCALRFRALTEAPVDGQSLQLLLSLSRESEGLPHSSHAVLISTAPRPPSDPRRRPFSRDDLGVLILWDELLLLSTSSTRGNSSTCLGARRGSGAPDELRLRIMLSADATIVRHAGCGVGATSQHWEAPLSLRGRRFYVHLLGLSPARAVGQAGRAVWGLAQLRETCQSDTCDGGSRLHGSYYLECICGCLDSWEAFLPAAMHPACFVPAPPGPPSAPPPHLLARLQQASLAPRSRPPPAAARDGAPTQNNSDVVASTRPHAAQGEQALLQQDTPPAHPFSERAGDSDSGSSRLPALFGAAVLPPFAILYYWLRLKPKWVRRCREMKGAASREHSRADWEAERAYLAGARDRRDSTAAGLVDGDGDSGEGILLRSAAMPGADSPAGRRDNGLLVTSATPMAAILDAPVLRATASRPPESYYGRRGLHPGTHVKGDQLAPQLNLAYPSAEPTLAQAAGASHLDVTAGRVVCPAFFEHRATFEAMADANAPSSQPESDFQEARGRTATVQCPQGASNTQPVQTPLVPPSPHALHMAVASHEWASAHPDANSTGNGTARKLRPLPRPSPMEGGAQKSEAMARLAQLGCDAAGARQRMLLRPTDRHPAQGTEQPTTP